MKNLGTSSSASSGRDKLLIVWRELFWSSAVFLGRRRPIQIHRLHLQPDLRRPRWLKPVARTPLVRHRRQRPRTCSRARFSAHQIYVARRGRRRRLVSPHTVGRHLRHDQRLCGRRPSTTSWMRVVEIAYSLPTLVARHRRGGRHWTIRPQRSFMPSASHPCNRGLILIIGFSRA